MYNHALIILCERFSTSCCILMGKLKKLTVLTKINVFLKIVVELQLIV